MHKYRRVFCLIFYWGCVKYVNLTVVFMWNSTSANQRLGCAYESDSKRDREDYGIWWALTLLWIWANFQNFQTIIWGSSDRSLLLCVGSVITFLVWLLYLKGLLTNFEFKTFFSCTTKETFLWKVYLVITSLTRNNWEKWCSKSVRIIYIWTVLGRTDFEHHFS